MDESQADGLGDLELCDQSTVAECLAVGGDSASQLPVGWADLVRTTVERSSTIRYLMVGCQKVDPAASVTVSDFLEVEG